MTPYVEGRLPRNQEEREEQVVHEGRGNQLTEEQKNYNYVHSSTRIVFENTFSMYVKRWRFAFKHLYLKDIDRLALAITACCVLHNICIDQDDFWETEVVSNSDLSGFQARDNDDGVEFLLAEPSTAEIDTSAENNMSEREVNSWLRQLKVIAENRRREIQRSL